jgi:hypothetical protein
MEHKEIIEKLKTIFSLSKELVEARIPALEGDVEIILSIVGDKLRYIVPEEFYEHIVKYE